MVQGRWVVYQFEIPRLFSAGSSDPPSARKQGVRASRPQRIAARMAALLMRWVRLLTRRAGAALQEEQGQGWPGRSCLSFTSSCTATGVTPPTLALPLKTCDAHCVAGPQAVRPPPHPALRQAQGHPLPPGEREKQEPLSRWERGWGEGRTGWGPPSPGICITRSRGEGIRPPPSGGEGENAN